MKQQIQKRLLPAIIIVVTVYFVFFFKTDITRYRIFQELWNLGHIFLFIAISYVILKKILSHAKLSIFSEFLIIILTSIVIGFSIEIIQTYTGRDKSTYDVVLDTVGASIAFILFSKAFRDSSKNLRTLFSSLVIIFSVLSLYPMFINVVDAINQRMEYPILLANNSLRETTRFNKNNAELDIVNNKIDDTHKNLLRVTFKPAKYPTISLESFNKNWLSYKFLKFSIYNPAHATSMVILRIHDRVHEKNGYKYNDRFNLRINLNSGWNEVKIRLSDVKQAPLNRTMSMDQVTGLMLFKMNSRVTDTLYFSQIQLTQ